MSRVMRVQNNSICKCITKQTALGRPGYSCKPGPGGAPAPYLIRDAYPLRRTRVSWAESDGVAHSKGSTPRSPWDLGVLAKTRPRHHSGPIRGVVPGTARIRETTALGGTEPIAGTGRTPVRPGDDPGPPWIAGQVRGHGGSAVDKRQQSMVNKDGSAF